MIYLPMGLSSIEEIVENNGGHNIGEVFEDNGHNVVLRVYNGKLCYVYEDLKLEKDEIRYYLHQNSSIAVSSELLGSLYNNPSNVSKEFLNQVVELATNNRTDAMCNLRTFIQEIRDKYSLHPNTDYSGDKLYIPIADINVQSVPDTDGGSGCSSKECKCQ